MDTNKLLGEFAIKVNKICDKYIRTEWVNYWPHVTEGFGNIIKHCEYLALLINIEPDNENSAGHIKFTYEDVGELSIKVVSIYPGCEFSIEIDMKSFNRSRYFRIKTTKEWRKIEKEILKLISSSYNNLVKLKECDLFLSNEERNILNRDRLLNKLI